MRAKQNKRLPFSHEINGNRLIIDDNGPVKLSINRIPYDVPSKDIVFYLKKIIAELPTSSAWKNVDDCYLNGLATFLKQSGQKCVFGGAENLTCGTVHMLNQSGIEYQWGERI